jgi:hypothetical protein
MTPFKTVNAYTVALHTTGDGKRALVMRPAPGTADFLVMEVAEARHALECGACATVVCGDDALLAAMMVATVEVAA